LIICTKIKHEVYLEGIIIQLIIKQLIFKYFIYMISIKKIMSVIAIAFAVMTIAGSGVISFAGNGTVTPTPSAKGSIDPCTDTTNAGCSSGILKTLGLDGLTGTGGITGAIQGVANFLVIIIASVSVIYLILGAYKMISDSGDGKGFSAGKDNVKYAILGLIVALLAFSLVSLITRFVTKA
jgi:Type IV secretion system pilin